ncbi:hypothetical protein [Streptodolium elevatio]
MTRLDNLLAARRRALEEDTAAYDLTAATRRLAGRIAGDELAAVLYLHPTCGTAHPAAPATQSAGTGDGGGMAVRRGAEQLLEACCMTAVRHQDAAALVSAFPHDYRPAGAVVFACLLYLTGRAEAAAFWWRYAGGAEDAHAARLLALYHWSIADPVTAAAWDDHAPPPAPVPHRAPRHTPHDAAALVASAEPAIRVVADDPDCGEVCLPDDDLGLILAACR